ncbi:hypothetical protein PPACK8108_LOCUS10662, partial [Phakopsora pachyrhizi]
VKELCNAKKIKAFCLIDNSGLHNKLKFCNHHSKTKYLDAKAKWIKDKYESNEIKIQLIRTNEMIADFLGKA